MTLGPYGEPCQRQTGPSGRSELPAQAAAIAELAAPGEDLHIHGGLQGRRGREVEIGTSHNGQGARAPVMTLGGEGARGGSREGAG